jgi:amyloid beta precursor protein binding protein 1
LGGIGAQEAIKVVTKQYIPINNTVVYDGIKQAVGVFQL